ncbi:MAG: hypothetical protein SYC29_11780 [Planctomycetota bacterium]|nr:hypothetical protein [Planctomycetota bacterium]
MQCVRDLMEPVRTTAGTFLVLLGATTAWGDPLPSGPAGLANAGAGMGPLVASPAAFGGQCPGDVDDDDDTDWSDLAILLADWGCEGDCVADLNGDGTTGVQDLLLLLADWACPDGDGSCDEPGSGVVTVAVAEVDNTGVGPGDDPLEPAFDGGVTHFTFDLQVTAAPGEDWGAAESEAVTFDEQTMTFFTHALGSGAPPPVEYLPSWPALEFDSYWCAATQIGSGEVGLTPYTAEMIWTPVQLRALWCDIIATPDGPYTVARHTIVVPAGGEATPPRVVPLGTGGDVPVVGTITGWVTNSSYNPGCDDFLFDIIFCGPDSDGDGYGDDCDNCPDHYNPDQADCDDDGMGDVCAIADGFSEDCQPNGVPDECDIADGTSEDENGNGVPDECEDQCPGDVDEDYDTDWSDLAIVLADHGCEEPPECVGDVDNDGDTDFNDILALLTDWGCPDGDGSCDEPGSGLILISAVDVDNSSVGPGDDPNEPVFDGGVTHFTFDIRVDVEEGEDWGAAGSHSLIIDPVAEFFVHSVDLEGHPPDPAMFAVWPALEFDSYWCAPTEIPPGGAGSDPPGLWVETWTPTELTTEVWLDLQLTEGGPYTIARHTIIVPPGGAETPPAIVAAGSGGETPIIATVTGWVTNASYEPGCEDFEFDILHCGPDSDEDGFGDDCDNCPDHYNPEQTDCDNDGIGDVCAIAEGLAEDLNENGIPDHCECPADFDDDWDTDTADLLILLGEWGEDGSEGGDVDFDGDVDTEDLLDLLGRWGDCPSLCPWDFNEDGVVDDLDRDILLDHWGDCPDPPEECPWDLDGDGDVDNDDLTILLEHYGECP